MSRKMNWGRMTAQYRNRQIRLAIARSRPKYRTNAAPYQTEQETIMGSLMLIGFMLILLFISLSSCTG